MISRREPATANRAATSLVQEVAQNGNRQTGKSDKFHITSSDIVRAPVELVVNAHRRRWTSECGHVTLRKRSLYLPLQYR